MWVEDGSDVLMPCRALEAFRRKDPARYSVVIKTDVLMPCRALEAFRLMQYYNEADVLVEYDVLMPRRALEAFRRQMRSSPTSIGSGVLMPCRALEAFRLRSNDPT